MAKARYEILALTLLIFVFYAQSAKYLLIRTDQMEERFSTLNNPDPFNQMPTRRLPVCPKAGTVCKKGSKTCDSWVTVTKKDKKGKTTTHKVNACWCKKNGKKLYQCASH